MFEDIRSRLNFFPPKKSWQQLAKQSIIENDLNDGPLPVATYYGSEYPIYNKLYDGEKNQGELGAPIYYVPDYTALALRSWQAYVESDVAQIILNTYLNWIVGSGLKLQSEPVKPIIESTGVDFNFDEYVKTVETRFRLYAKQNFSTHSQMKNLHRLARSAVKHAILGGDVLCIIRTTKQGPTMQLINGSHVQTPIGESREKENGNKIVHGAEYREPIKVDKDYSMPEFIEKVEYYLRESIKRLL